MKPLTQITLKSLLNSHFTLFINPKNKTFSLKVYISSTQFNLIKLYLKIYFFLLETTKIKSSS